MSFQIQTDLSSLSQMLLSIRSKGKLFSKNELDVIINRVGKKLNDLDFDAKQGFTPLTEFYRAEAIELLSELRKELKLLSKQSEKVHQVRSQILSVTAHFQEALFTQEKTIVRPKIGLQIGFFCDISVPDGNGLIINDLYKAATSQLPFITTRSLLKGTQIKENEEHRIKWVGDVENFILSHQNEWEVYQLFDPEFGKEFLVFLPASLFPHDMDEFKKLKALDLATDGTLKRISFKEAFQGPEGKNNIQAFFNIFAKEPKIDKLFYLDGHGSSQSIGGMNIETYRSFLDFIERQRCRGLVIDSCEAAGEVSLFNDPGIDLRGRELVSFEDQIKGHSFYTIVNSIGDFSTSFHADKELTPKESLERLTAFISGQETSTRLRDIFEKGEGNRHSNPENYEKVYFPHTAGIPGGFRPIGQRGRGYSLTYSVVKQAELRSKKPFAESDVIQIKNSELLEIHPLVTLVPLVCAGENPILISMIPGKGHHYLKSIQLVANQDQMDFFSRTVNFHSSAETQVSKGFFIETLAWEGQIFKNVVIYVAPKKSIVLYCEGGKHYYLNGGLRVNTTAFEYAVMSRFVEAATKPKEAAIQAVSAGQESEKSFQEAILGWFPEKFLFLETLLANKNEKEFLAITKTLKLTEREKETLLIFLIQRGFERLALKYLKNENINPNLTDLEGKALVFFVIRNKMPRILKYLMKQNVNLRVHLPGQRQYTPLHLAVLEGNKQIIQILLQDKRVVLRKRLKDEEDSQGWTPLAYVFRAPSFDPEIFQMLTTEEGDVRKLSKLGPEILCDCILDKDNEKLDFLLKQIRVFPNLGNPSALSLAIYSQDPILIDKLIRAGGSPFRKESSGTVPFVEAVMRSPIEIVQKLMKKKDCNFDIKDKAGVSPLVGALFFGNQETIEALRKRGVHFPATLEPQEQQMMNHVMERLHRLGDTEAIKQLLQWNNADCADFTNLFREFLKVNNFSLLKECIREKLFSKRAA